jgi:hypothetical protein
MLSELDHFCASQPEPDKSCLLALRKIILSHDPEISTAWKYGMPFFCYKGKMFCYLWVQKLQRKLYVGIVEGKSIQHPNLLLGKRARMKIMLFDPNDDLPIKTIQSILIQTLDLYKKGKIKIKN